MNTQMLLITIACTGLLAASCATTAPQELVNARNAYQQASNGPASQVAQAELHVAHKALTTAEQSFRDYPDSYRTLDLAYVTQRKSELAEATASIVNERRNQAQAKEDFTETQGRIVEKTKKNLSQTQGALADSERSGKVVADKLQAEKVARAKAEQETADALAALAKLAAVKNEARGMVITLSGSVLFASNQSALLPEAKTRLDQVVAVLLTTRERKLVVEGHTDSQGSDSFNLDLSQRRADSVRDYLVQSGYEGDLVVAHGMGEGHPVADNGAPEGRANNRRVEIIIERAPQTANQ